MKNQIFLLIISVIAISLLTLLLFFPNFFLYRLMGTEGIHKFMTETRDYGIHMAQERGEYRCCIEPACTMCYFEANKWNYGKAGTCVCDDFIARGEEPCPQCVNALDCSSTSENSEICTIDLNE